MDNVTHSQFHILARCRFLPLFVTQALGAFNDNAFKNALVVLITFGIAEKAGIDGKLFVTLARVAVFLSEVGVFVEPSESLAVLADEPDNRILECALASDAQLIVTGDRAMLAQGEFRSIRIVSLAAYLAEAG